MRGVAALVVALYHADLLWGFKPGSGYLAVDLFFILSGFVLAYAYDDRFACGMSPLEFMRIRLIRLYPLYLLGLVAVTVAILADYLIAAHVSWTPSGLAESLALSLGFLPTPPGIAPRDSIYPMNTPAWSLAFELVINLGWALTWRHLSNRILAGIVIISGATLVAVTGVFGSLDVGWTWASLLAGFPRVMFSFSLGVLLLRLRRDEERVQLRIAPVLTVVAVLVLLFIRPADSLRPAYDLVCVTILFPLLVLVGARAQPSRRLALVFGFAGAISYALYALHFPILEVLVALFTVLTHGRVADVQPWGGILSLSVFLAVACIADRYCDRPIRRWLTDKSHRVRKTVPSVTS